MRSPRPRIFFYRQYYLDSLHQDHDSHHHDASHHHDGPETCLISQAEAGAVVRHGDGPSLSAAMAVLTGGWESPLMEGEPVRFAPTVREAMFRPHCAASRRMSRGRF